MFIDDSISNKYYAEATAEPSYLLEAVIEANEAIHNISMKMVKCEHSCIVNEDANMLSEAEAAFGDKVKKVAQTLLAKFMAFIDRVRAEWSKLWANTISRFIKGKKAEDFMKGLNKSDNKIEISEKNFEISNPMAYTNLDEMMKYVASSVDGKSMDSIEVAKKKLESFLLAGKDAAASKQSVAITPDLVKKCHVFLVARPQHIKYLERFKQKGKEAYKKDVEANKANKDSLLIAKFSSLCSKCIMHVNSFTSSAVKVLRYAMRKTTITASTPENETPEQRKARLQKQYGDKLNDKKNKSYSQSNYGFDDGYDPNIKESVLDLFD